MSDVTRAELVERARKLAPGFAKRAEECENLRRLPEASMDDIKRAGLLRAFVADEFGGYGLEIATVIETSREVAKACGSTGWCLAICTLHNHIVSAFPRVVQAEVFAQGPDTVVCGVFMPAGRAYPVDGGFCLNGSWNFASTSDYSEYAVLAGLLFETAEEAASKTAVPTGVANFLVPRADYEIEDNWFVSGMRGTGSKKVVVDEAFVASDHVMQEAMGEGDEAMRSKPRLSAGLPGFSVATLGLTGVAIGIAQGALERFRERLAMKVRVSSTKSADRQVAGQLRYAQSAAEVDAAELIVMRDLDEMTRNTVAGIKATYEERARYRRDAAFAIQSCTKAVANLQPAAGGHAIFDHEPLQRALRDIQAFSAHLVADWDAAGEAYARAMTGLPKEDPLV